MALIYDQAVPPSLLEAYQALLSSKNRAAPDWQTVALLPSVRRAGTAAAQTSRERFATEAAGWLRDTWHPSASTAARSAFYAARRAEILAGTFPATWWAPASKIGDLTEYCVPVVSSFVGEYDPAYLDPLRQPSVCKFVYPLRSYPTPAAPGTVDNPSPSWKGAVVDNVWRDTYSAQRRVRFSLPFPISRDEDRPIALRCDATISATATVRGNRNWFALIAQPIFHSVWWYPAPYTGAQSRWAPEDGWPFELPGDAPGGWSYELSRTLIRSGRDKALWESVENAAYVSLYLLSPPSLGRYGSRNDAVTVYHAITAQLWQAKTP